MIIIGALNLFSAVPGTYETPTIDVSEFETIRSLILGTASGGLRYYWSVDGITFPLNDLATFDAGVAISYTVTIKAKYLKIEYSGPNTYSVQHLFQSGPPSLSSLGNLGAGVQLYNSLLNGVKSVVSDGSVSVSGTSTQLSVSAASGMLAPVASNSDVQITHAAGVFSIGIAKGAKAGANSLYITGTNTAGNVGVGDGSIGVGGGVGGSAGVLNNSVVVGYTAGAAGCGVDSVVVGMGAGSVTSTSGNKVSIGRNAGYTTQGANTVAVGSAAGYSAQSASSVAVGNQAGAFTQGGSATALGTTAAYTGQGNNSVAVGKSAGYTGQGVNAVAVGTESSYTNQGAGAIALGYRASYTAAQPAASVAIGYNCAPPGAVGRLSFGNTMEAVAATATAGGGVLPAAPAAFIRIEWNGTLYKIPVYNN